ncbi:DUF2182 domain-containing protein [Burkholderia sp. Ac-20353]|uniref:DUF2182 domain-containing protein n=1 Tax=Burkholderia sp. Ac-20353 TaxID=2703894 RepID=UPI00197C17AF|nr:DUF2182 domain-containing protein [Burkholderia sp. Ac-20353]MBN3793020.1 DUF2182 domain-containing protein [Burkholderia sp. Ac-20353]
MTNTTGVESRIGADFVGGFGGDACVPREVADRPPRSAVGRASRHAFAGVLVVLFAAGVAGTIVLRASMASMGGVPMAGGWTLSTAWGPLCGQSWPGAVVAFLGMWGAMTVAMMLPSLAPTLWRYRQAVGVAGVTGNARRGRLTALVGAGYLSIWGAFGLAVFPAGALLVGLAVRMPGLVRAFPVLAGVVVLVAGALQFTGWKARRLACCRGEAAHAPSLPTRAGAAWRHGLRVGLHCGACCTNLMAIALATGIMDLCVMAAVAAAIAAERVAPDGRRAARIVGCLAVVTGLWMIARAAGLA